MLTAKKFKTRLRTSIRSLKVDASAREEVLIWIDRIWLDFLEKQMIPSDTRDVRPSSGSGKP